MTDPADIDLKWIQSWSTQVSPIPDLIAAVEVLRERIERMQARTIEQNIEYMQALGFALERANKADSHVIELKGVLENLIPSCKLGIYHPRTPHTKVKEKHIKEAHTILAKLDTPAKEEVADDAV